MLHEGDLAKDIVVHLQSKGKYIKAQDIVCFLDLPEMKAQHGYSKTISLRTAQRWLLMMDFCFTKAPRGQYIDGHEREDVVEYRQEVFLPNMAYWTQFCRRWEDRNETMEDEAPIFQATLPDGQRVVLWFHDKSTFYANDRRKVYWRHKSETPKPEPKGEGASCMVADFVSADYGWLRSLGGAESAQILFKAGRNRDGYFTHTDVLNHAHRAMDILAESFPHDYHILIFDNASTHRARADSALSARNMTKGPSSNFFCIRTVRGSNGTVMYNEQGKKKTEKIRMEDAQFADNTAQPLYHSDGRFKGIVTILEEQGFKGVSELLLECNRFKCIDRSIKAQCCCRRILYNQPDFRNVPSQLEKECAQRGFLALFLPKFHPELSFIEQCWGYAKRVYREYLPSSSEAALEDNVKKALDSVPFITMRR